MSDLFREELDKFVSSGNLFEGPIPQIEGKFRIIFSGSGCRLVFGENVRLKGARLRFNVGGGEIVLGKSVKHYGSLIVGNGSRIQIGDGTRMNAAVRLHAIEGKSITIGKHCLFSDVRARTSDMHSILDLDTGQRINPAADIVIEDRVWIAEDVRIYKGITIGTGSIVGARSTVTKDLPSNCLCVGTPARAVKPNVSWRNQLV